jgi:hypothetical protein
MNIKVDTQYVREDLIERAKRLIRMIELNAPDEIVVTNIVSINNLLPAFGSAWLNHKMIEDLGKISSLKSIYDQCANPECGESTHNIKGDFCLKCISVNDQRDAEIDEIINNIESGEE